MIAGIYSITVAVKDMPKAVQNYEALLGIKAQYVLESEPEAEATLARFAFDSQRNDVANIGFDSNASMAHFQLPGGARIILITSLDRNSVVGAFLAKKGEGVLKVSLRVNDANAEVNRVKNSGLALVLDKNAVGEFGETNFVHPKSLNGVEFELFEPKGLYRT